MQRSNKKGNDSRKAIVKVLETRVKVPPIARVNCDGPLASPCQATSRIWAWGAAATVQKWKQIDTVVY